MGGVVSILTHSDKARQLLVSMVDFEKAHVGCFVPNITHLSYVCVHAWVKKEITLCLWIARPTSNCSSYYARGSVSVCLGTAVLQATR